jgi:hypothetical protein
MTGVDATGPADSYREVIRIDEGQIESHVDQLARESVEQNLNALLVAEADAVARRAPPFGWHAVHGRMVGIRRPGTASGVSGVLAELQAVRTAEGPRLTSRGPAPQRRPRRL